jgi:SAM-dependent methyltransferase
MPEEPDDATTALVREDGRRLFGLDPAVYAAGRPQYPPALYAVLEERCGLGTGTQVLEIGPGTGLVTRRLLQAGASVVAVEPNASLAAYLRDSYPASRNALRVEEALFEEAQLGDDAFDLAVAATSFHWVDQQPGLAKLGRVVRPGGCVAVWWTLFQDPTALDEFSLLAQDVLHAQQFAFEEPDRPPFQLDSERRVLELGRWGGFEDLHADVIRTPVVLGSEEVRAMYASVASVLRLARAEQQRVLDRLESLARDRFGGQIERTFVTALYTGRRPG